jgi:L-lactate dehydrogenase complex protein LldF
MQATSADFKANAHRALGDPNLQRAMGMMRTGFPKNRAAAIARLPEFDALRDEGMAIKNHVLAHLDFYLEAFEAKVVAQGGKVHWCRTAQEACETVLGLCRALGAKTVTKGKSMIGEEIALNDFLEAHAITPVETDLGEYIVQIRHETPSHIIAPAVHLVKEQVAESFRATHTHLPASRSLEEPRTLCDEARSELRQKFLAADVGITGANFLVAETGSSIIVTNEGNGDLTQILPKAHIVLASIEKIVPTLEDAATLLRLLARSATGQEFSTYTTISTGPLRAADNDGPGEYHVVLLDNGRSALLGGEFQDMLRCIRCAACLNHCPVYGAVGGHAYGWVYSGPMGAVLTPTLIGIDKAGNLPNASTFCGRCESVCPMRIPLPAMMRHWREREFASKLSPKTQRWGVSLWAYVAQRPALYRRVSAAAARILGILGGARGRFRSLPLASGWTDMRDLPAPEGKSFMTLWAERDKAAARAP